MGVPRDVGDTVFNSDVEVAVVSQYPIDVAAQRVGIGSGEGGSAGAGTDDEKGGDGDVAYFHDVFPARVGYVVEGRSASPWVATIGARVGRVSAGFIHWRMNIDFLPGAALSAAASELVECDIKSQPRNTDIDNEFSEE